MEKLTIVWADDEIDLLKPHIMFLEEKGYEVVAVTSGDEALDEIAKEYPDIVFLDENMPGLSGLDTLTMIKNSYPNLPVIMITKSEEEHIMDEALGGKISDYLIKPVNPKQILLTVKKHIDGKRLVSQKSTQSYQQSFREISMQLLEKMTANEWVELYKKLVYWDLELSRADDGNIHDILYSQKEEANRLFCKFYEDNYEDWLNGRTEKPLISPTVLKEKMFPLLKSDKPTFLIVIDNLRYDHWKQMQPTIEEYFHTVDESLYYSILPTTTQYARNSLFSGLMPAEIQKKYPNYWVDEDEEGYKNQYEHELLDEYLKRYGHQVKHAYYKVLNAQYGKKLVDSLSKMMNNKLNVIIYNFIDMLSHARTELDIVRELAENEKAYRSLTLSWLEHSPLMEMLKALAEKDVNVIITTDHGSVKINNPIRVKGDKDISVNLRYKVGRLLDYNPKQVYEVKDAAKIFLPKLYVTSPYIFARGGDFFAYPNNYNQYVSYYMNTFQHGGISLEENLIPFITLQTK
ncbi:MAG: bifunctional response regulator/alkaline phosphatase family protein [Bacteroidales bacterium]|nr:bifunctional response regulator/alkaline phosphatase family protein [Bacteroidales bacterium]